MPCHGKRVEPGISQGKQVKGILEAEAKATTFLGQSGNLIFKKKHMVTGGWKVWGR